MTAQGVFRTGQYQGKWLLGLTFAALIVGLATSVPRGIACSFDLNSTAVGTMRGALTGSSEPLAISSILHAASNGQCPSSLASRSWFLEGIRYEQLGQDDLALQKHEQASAVGTWNGLALFRQGNILARQGFEEDAIAVWRRAAAAPYFAAQGRESRLQGDFDVAERALTRAIAINPDGIKGQLELATLLRQRGSRVQAVSSYRRVLEIDPRNLDANYHLGLMYRELGQLAAARHQAEVSIAIEPSYVWAYILAGDTYRLEGAFDDADDWYRRLLRITGGTSLAHKYLGINALDRDDLVGAVAHFDSSLSEAAGIGRADIYYWLGQAYARQALYERAIEAHAQAAQLDPTNAHFALGLAGVYEQAGRLEDAIDQYRAVLRLDPENLSAGVRLSQLLSGG